MEVAVEIQRVVYEAVAEYGVGNDYCRVDDGHQSGVVLVLNVAHADRQRRSERRQVVLIDSVADGVGAVVEQVQAHSDERVGAVDGGYCGLVGYGIGGVAILFFLKRFRHNHFSLFLASFILCGVLEYIGAWLLETFKHLKYWDYSGYYLNLQGRVCLEGLLIFGLGGCGFTYIAGPLLENFLSKYTKHLKKIVAIILLFIFSIDLIIATFIRPNTGKGISDELIYIKRTL